jgi:hypothetical protein
MHASWILWDGANSTPERNNEIAVTATTKNLVPSPASAKQINVKVVSIRNVHASVSNTITVVHTDGTDAVEVFKTTLFVGELLIFNEQIGWRVFDSSGNIKLAGNVDPRTNDFRLTGTSATPIMTADLTSLSTVYLAQHKGNRIALYDGANWQLVQPGSEPSLAVTGRTTDLPFDVFGYLNAGTVTLEFLDWTNATTRATGLSRQDGIWIKSGDPTRRYLGSIRARSATTFHWVRNGIDLPAKFDLFNVDNRVEFPWQVIATTNSWTYTTATWRQAQASTNYQCDVMVGLQEESFTCIVAVSSRNSTISIPRQVGVGFDSTTVISGLAVATANVVASIECDQWARLVNMPAIGRHFYAWLEISTATGTCTWVGDDGALRLQSGMAGTWAC